MSNNNDKKDKDTNGEKNKETLNIACFTWDKIARLGSTSFDLAAVPFFFRIEIDQFAFINHTIELY